MLYTMIIWFMQLYAFVKTHQITRLRFVQPHCVYILLQCHKQRGRRNLMGGTKNAGSLAVEETKSKGKGAREGMK